MTNDNTDNSKAPESPETATVTASHGSPETGHLVYRHVAKLLELQAAAAALVAGFHDKELSETEQALAVALQEPLLDLKKGNQLLNALVRLLEFILPGKDIFVEGLSIAGFTNPQGDRTVGLILLPQAGKSFIKILTKPEAEEFAREFAHVLDEQFNRQPN